MLAQLETAEDLTITVITNTSDPLTQIQEHLYTDRMVNLTYTLMYLKQQVAQLLQQT